MHCAAFELFASTAHCHRRQHVPSPRPTPGKFKRLWAECRHCFGSGSVGGDGRYDVSAEKRARIKNKTRRRHRWNGSMHPALAVPFRAFFSPTLRRRYMQRSRVGVATAGETQAFLQQRCAKELLTAIYDVHAHYFLSGQLVCRCTFDSPMACCGGKCRTPLRSRFLRA